MTEPPSSTPLASKDKPISVLTCWSGSLVSASLAILMYRLTTAIAAGFARQGMATDNMTVYRIKVAVRTLVVGISALGTFIFAFVGLGLLALGVQRLWERFSQGKTQPNKDPETES